MTTVTSATVADLPAQSVAAPATTPRITSIDAFRGFVMFLMLAEVMRLWTLRRAFPDEQLLGVRGLQHHARAVAGVLASRSDSAGVFVPGRRVAAILDREPQQQGRELQAHARSRRLAQRRADPPRHLPPLARRARGPTGRSRTRSRRSASATRSCFSLAFASLRVQVIAFVTLLVGFWAAFVLYPLPSPGFDYTQVGVPAGLAAPLHGLPRPLQQELESRVGVRRLVPEPVPAREAVPVQRRRMVDPQLHSDAGDDDARAVGRRLADDVTLDGGEVEGPGHRRRRAHLRRAVLQWLHINPIVKRIWTSSYTLYSGGLVVLMLAGFYALIEWKGWRRWSFPLLVIGANSIAIYVMSWTIEEFVVRGSGAPSRRRAIRDPRCSVRAGAAEASAS